MPPSTAKKDFFISYNKADRGAAEWIAWLLDEEKYSVTIQAWDFGPGGNFVVEMQRAIEQCERVLAVLSPDYLTSLYTLPEWAAYFAEHPTSEQRKIVPVRVRECDLKGLLAPIVYIDLFGKDESTAKGELLAGVKMALHSGDGHRGKPLTKPDYFGAPPRAVESKPRFFGALPDIWNVPHLRNPNFTEPGQRLVELRDALRSGKPAALTQALAGLGGVGKTSLAIEYAYRHGSDYALVWWLRAEQPAALAADYAALAGPLDLPEKDAAEQPVIIAAVRTALRRRNDWLLVFDNAETTEDVRPFLPGAGGHVIITSRHQGWGSLAQKVEVKKWSLEIAVEFLAERTGSSGGAAAADLAREMDCLPLALEQAAAYIEATGGSLAAYLALFRQHQIELLQRGAPSGEGSVTVATTWELSFQRLEKESPTGAALLNLCAFFAPDNIPRDVIVAGAEDLPEPLGTAVRNPLAFDDAVAEIRRYSLIETGPDSTVSLHRLVQTLIRHRLSEVDRKVWAEAAVRVMVRAFPEGCEDVRTWSECSRLLPHANVTIEHAETLSVALKQAANLINETGVYSLGRAEYSTAKEAFERALQIDEKVFGAEHPTVAMRVNNLGSALQDLGDLPSAKAAYERALKIDEKAFGSEHPSVAIGINNLGSVLKALGDFSGAKAAYERALQINEKVFGSEHPSVAIGINNLGSVLKALGDFSGAKAAYERALKMAEEAFGSDHPTVATRVNNLGGVLQDLGDLLGAKAAFERALKIDEKAFGSVHPKIAIRVNNLGSVLQSLGDLPGARAAFVRTLQIDETVFGPDHPEVATDINNLGCVLHDSGDLLGARVAFERALAILQKHFEDNHPHVKAVKRHLQSLPPFEP